MKKTEEREMDLNRRFMNPEKIEKAPEGFTDNVMSAVRVGSRLVVNKKERAKGFIVPAAVLAFMLVLVIISVFSGIDKNTVSDGAISKILQDISLFKIKTPSLPGLTLPGIVVYISLGIFVLGIFDLFLGRIFYRRQ